MPKFQHDVMLRVVKIRNVLMIELPFAVCWFLYYSNQVYAKFAWKGNLAILGLFFVIYIAHPNLIGGLKIMFATVKILFMPASTEGVSEGQTTAMSGGRYKAIADLLSFFPFKNQYVLS